ARRGAVLGIAEEVLRARRRERSGETGGGLGAPGRPVHRRVPDQALLVAALHRVEGAPLDGLHLDLDAYLLAEPGHGFADLHHEGRAGERGVEEGELEAIRMTGLGEKLLG